LRGRENHDSFPSRRSPDGRSGGSGAELIQVKEGIQVFCFGEAERSESDAEIREFNTCEAQICSLALRRSSPQRLEKRGTTFPFCVNYAWKRNCPRCIVGLQVFQEQLPSALREFEEGLPPDVSGRLNHGATPQFSEGKRAKKWKNSKEGTIGTGLWHNNLTHRRWKCRVSL